MIAGLVIGFVLALGLILWSYIMWSAGRARERTEQTRRALSGTVLESIMSQQRPDLKEEA